MQQAVAWPPAERSATNDTLKCPYSVGSSKWADKLSLKRKTMHFVEERQWRAFFPFHWTWVCWRRKDNQYARHDTLWPWDDRLEQFLRQRVVKCFAATKESECCAFPSKWIQIVLMQSLVILVMMIIQRKHDWTIPKIKSVEYRAKTFPGCCFSVLYIIVS